MSTADRRHFLGKTAYPESSRDTEIERIAALLHPEMYDPDWPGIDDFTDVASRLYDAGLRSQPASADRTWFDGPLLPDSASQPASEPSLDVAALAEILRSHSDRERHILPPLVEGVAGGMRYMLPEEFAAYIAARLSQPTDETATLESR